MTQMTIYVKFQNYFNFMKFIVWLLDLEFYKRFYICSSSCTYIFKRFGTTIFFYIILKYKYSAVFTNIQSMCIILVNILGLFLFKTFQIA